MFRGIAGALVAALLVGVFLSACAPGAAPYPQRPVEIISLDPPGGPTDLVARVLAESVQADFGQPLVVANHPGGAGTIAAVDVVKAAPDGYTIGLQAVGPMALQPYRSQLPYRTVDDYRPVINLVRQPLVFAVRAEASWTTVPAVIDQVRLDATKLRVGLPGAGTIADLVLDQLESMTRAKFQRVHFNSAPEAVQGLLGGNVEAVVVGPPGLVSPVKAGKARVVAAFEAGRDAAFLDAPTFKEAGYDVTLGGYFFVIAPKGTPDAVIDMLHRTFKKGLESEKFRALAEKSGFVLDYQGPAELKQRLADDYALFGRLLGITSGKP